MNYATTEDEIKAALVASPDLLALADVKLYPDAVDEYKTPVAKGLVTVIFLGEDYANNQSVGDISQPVTFTYGVSIQARKLRGSGGVYAIAEIVKQLLIGLPVSDADNFMLSEQKFNQYQNDIWEHTLTFSCKSLRVQSNHNQLPDMDITNGDEVFYKKQTTNENIRL